MDFAKTPQIIDKVIRLMGLQVEVLKDSLLEITVSQIHDYEDRRDRIGQLCRNLGTD